MDRYSELIKKEKTIGLTPEEHEELSELMAEEYEKELSESERVGMVQTQWGCM